MTYLYHYDSQYLNRHLRTEARMSPLEPSVPLVPRNATLVEPIGTAREGVILKFNLDTNLWEEIDDNRGYMYWTYSGGEVTIDEVGIPIPIGAIKSLDTFPILWDEEAGAWRLKNEVDNLIEYKIQLIEANRAFAGELIAGFFNTSYGTNKMRDKQWLHGIRYLEINKQESELAPGETLSREDLEELQKLIDIKDDIRSIREAENVGEELINIATNLTEALNNSQIVWPDPTHDKTIKIN